MSFLGLYSGASSVAAASEGSPVLSLANLKLTSATTHSRSDGRRRVSRKGKHRTVLKLFNIAASVPGVSRNLTPASIVCSLATTQTIFSTTSTTVPVFASYIGTLSAFVDVAAYTNLFDQYRIDEMELWITPQAPQGTTTFAAQFYAVDLDDGNVPTSSADVIDKQSSVESSGPSGIYIKWQPHMAVALYSGTFTSYGNEPAGWIDCASPNVQHYGVKAAFEPTPSSFRYIVHAKARVSFRSAGL